MPSQFTTSQYLAARRAIDLNIPFALFANPGETEYSFFASYPDEEHFNELTIEGPPHEKAFFVNTFAASLQRSYLICDRLSTDDILALPSSTRPLPEPDVTPQYLSTPYPYYYAKVREAKEKIRKRQLSKVVLSRCVNSKTAIHPVDIADRYFALCPDTFRAIYFTQETGLWVTATPELLLEAGTLMPDAADGVILRSMSLAGTRMRSTAGKINGDDVWDDKNLEEHRMVLDFIISTMNRFGVKTTVSDAVSVPFGSVEHRRHIIEGRIDDKPINIYMLLDELSPTPALAGYPVEKAIRFIGENELHNRLCYGGLIGTMSDSGMRLFVNIRCALFGPELNLDGTSTRDVNIFAGGGIMSSSLASREWIEAAEKAKPIFSLLDEHADISMLTERPEGWRELD